jgi:RNA recognition motif-containing protein
MQVFCGNFEYDAMEQDVRRLFEKYGRVERIDMKTGEGCCLHTLASRGGFHGPAAMADYHTAT